MNSQALQHAVVDSPWSADSFTLRTGRSACRALFQPQQYQLRLQPEQGDTERVELGFAGSRVLERLLQTPGEVVTREDLLGYAWADRVVSQGSLNQQIYVLRQILGDEKGRQIIQTLPRRGYLFNPDYIEAEQVLPASSAETPATVQASLDCNTSNTRRKLPSWWRLVALLGFTPLLATCAANLPGL
ncbi:winged helix-turn-helix domain-containing protein [Pseudomonas sp. B392_1p]|uniref:winged helix-turn-helix domain-containing protein n=1 Tax=Pseudomonas sp. B392_1p TaxID=3457507 RepID=UPI003FD6B37B